MKKQEIYGPNILTPNKKLYYIFLLSVFSQVGEAGVISTLVIELFKYDSSGGKSSVINVVSLLGTSLIGIFGSIALAKFKGFIIGFYLPIMSFILIISFIYFRSMSIYISFFFIFLLALFNGLELPNNNSTIPLLVTGKADINRAYSLYQTIVQGINIVTPLLVSILLNYYTFEVTYWFFGLFYLISIIPWLKLKSVLPASEKSEESGYQNKWQKLFEGYYKIFKNKNILFLNLNRLFNNMLFSVLATASPFFIGYLASENLELVSRFRNYFSSLTSLSFVVVGVLFTFKFLKNTKSVVVMAYLTPLTAFIGYTAFYVARNFFSFLLLGVCMGIGLYLGRISTVSMGQALTPRNDLAITIMAGDTITRIYTVIVNAIAVSIMTTQKEQIFNVVFVFVLIGMTGMLTLFIPTRNYVREVEIDNDRSRI